MTQCTSRGCRHLETKCVDCGRMVMDRIMIPGPEWISVKDKLPPFNKKVLALSEGADRIYICFRSEQEEYNEHWSICEDSDCSCVGCTGPIDYWMPLPEPPK